MTSGGVDDGGQQRERLELVAPVRHHGLALLIRILIPWRRPTVLRLAILMSGGKVLLDVYRAVVQRREHAEFGEHVEGRRHDLGHHAAPCYEICILPVSCLLFLRCEGAE
jgi:hypothetical protein